MAGVSCGKDHSIAWDANGVVYSWGLNADGRLGHEIEKDKGFFLNKFEVYPRRVIVKLL
jgi:alpha-tubulin suppressor-like RCC1 family protein